MTGALYAAAADLVLVVHLAFVLFVVFGGWLVRRRPRLAWIHLPCALYGAAIEVWGWICPLTPLEQGLRRAAGQGGASGDFVGRWLEGVLYPRGWARAHLALALAVVAVNLAAYAWAIRGRGRHGS